MIIASLSAVGKTPEESDVFTICASPVFKVSLHDFNTHKVVCEHVGKRRAIRRAGECGFRSRVGDGGDTFEHIALAGRGLDFLVVVLGLSLLPHAVQLVSLVLIDVMVNSQACIKVLLLQFPAYSLGCLHFRGEPGGVSPDYYLALCWRCMLCWRNV